MSFLKLPFFTELEKADNILIAGAGGGYDIFCGLPLYFALKNAGKQVHLANFSFSNVHSCTGKRHKPNLVEVDHATQTRQFYFPEIYLAQWSASIDAPISVYCISRSGVLGVREAYEAMVDSLNIDTIILIDGGTDSLMRGDEVGLGTPEEDVISLAAVHQINVPRKMLVSLGFGIDTFHGICHAQFLEAVADITKAGGFLGAWTLTSDMPEVQLYKEACIYVFTNMPHYRSIVSSSIISALEGQFGDYHVTERTHGSELFINPLMTMYWCFQLEHIVQRNLYIAEIFNEEHFGEVIYKIDNFRENLDKKIKKWQNIPL
jgi:hypothetical protein